MAKAGLWGLTRSLAIEGAPHNIRVNAILPMGYTRAASLNPNEDTRKWMEDFFPPRLVAPVGALLCHPDSPCTGELLSTGGGRVARIATIGVPGFNAGEELTIEALRDRWSEVMDMNGSKPLMMGREELAFWPDQGPSTY